MRTVNHTMRLSTAALLIMVLGGYVCATHAQASDIRNISRVNRSVQIDAGEQVGNVSSVNGRIIIGTGARAGEVDTVNGRIELGDNSSVESAGTVNGRIQVGENVQVGGDMKTVNGGITIRSGSIADGRVRTVNGDIELAGSRASDNLRTVNGDITLRNGSIVEGDIIFRDNQSWFRGWFNFGRDNRPDLIIDADSAVLGTVHLYREVDLRIHDDAQVGDIIEHY